jgi:hypothetical protein
MISVVAFLDGTDFAGLTEQAGSIDGGSPLL